MGLKFQSAFAGSIRQRSDSTVILVSPAVERDSADARRFAAFGNCLTNRLGCFAIATELDAVSKRFVEGAGGCQRHAVLVVNQLAGNVLIASTYRQTGLRSIATQLFTDAILSTPSSLIVLLIVFHFFASFAIRR